MKKWLIGVSSIFILFLLCVYVFIPSKILVAKSISANINQYGVYRFLSNDSNWQKWWPDLSSAPGILENSYNSGGYLFQKTKPLYNSFEIAIKDGKNTQSSFLNIFPYGNDSIKIEWSTIINTGTTPLSKLRNYFKAKELRNSLAGILTAMKKYISQDKNIYGIDIRMERVKNEFLIS